MKSVTPLIKYLVLGMAVLARKAVDSDVWALIVAGVNAIDDEPIDGLDKKKTVLAQIKEIAPNIAGWLLGLVIDVAVGKMRVTQ